MRVSGVAVLVVGVACASGALAGDSAARRLADEWIAACQNRDVATWQKLFAPEASYEDSVTPTPVKAVTHFGPFARLWPEASHWQCVQQRFIPLEQGGAIHWVAKGRVRDVDLEFVGLAVFGVVHQRIVWMRNYFDARSFLKLLRSTAAAQ
ncbi:MAG: hypothetical protein N3C12_15645 [Candidatus Binatia bacterium]|nr:hypothetical protein [Candidatus Binatia bacterium]